MKVTRRQFVKGGVAAFTVTFAAPEFLVDLARAQGAHVRNLVVLYMSGGNDSLSMLAPYNDPFYTSRRPTLAIPAGQVLQIGTDSSNVALGLHPRLTGLKQIFDQGRLALHSAHRSTTTRAARTFRAPTSGRPPIRTTRRARLGRALSRFAAVAGRSAGRLEHHRQPAARAAGAHGGAGDREPVGLLVLEPELRRRSDRRALHGAADRVARAGRSPGARVRLRQLAGRDRHARSRRHRRELRGRRSRIRPPASARRCRPWPAR